MVPDDAALDVFADELKRMWGLAPVGFDIERRGFRIERFVQLPGTTITGFVNPGTIGALVVAISFAAGLNVYATLLTLGVLSRLHWVVLPHGVDAVASWWVIGASAVMFLAEFIADKIPGFDLIWNAAQTLVRVPLAALLAFGATTHLSPGMQALATVAGGMLAMVAHSSKMAARVLVTPSPEPASNIALSSAEDVGAIGLVWVASHHPYAAAALVGVALLISIATIRVLWRALTRLRRRMGEWLHGRGTGAAGGEAVRRLD